MFRWYANRSYRMQIRKENLLSVNERGSKKIRLYRWIKSLERKLCQAGRLCFGNENFFEQTTYLLNFVFEEISSGSGSLSYELLVDQQEAALCGQPARFEI